MTKPVQKFSIKDGNLITVMPIHPEKSKAGKSMLLATTRGRESFEYHGKTVHVNLNAYVMLAEWDAPKS